MRRRSWLIGALSAFFGTHVGHMGTGRAASKDADPYQLRVLRDPEDRSTSLASHANHRSLVVVVMKGHWCPVCLDQLRRLTTLARRLEELGATAVGLNADGVEANRKVARAAGIQHPILSDRDHRVISRLGLWLADVAHPMPAIVVFDRCGTEVGRHVGRRPGESPERALLELLEEHAETKCGKPNA